MYVPVLPKHLYHYTTFPKDLQPFIRQEHTLTFSLAFLLNQAFWGTIVLLVLVLTFGTELHFSALCFKYLTSWPGGMLYMVSLKLPRYGSHIQFPLITLHTKHTREQMPGLKLCVSFVAWKVLIVSIEERSDVFSS